jgi:hypothetical protein
MNSPTVEKNSYHNSERMISVFPYAKKSKENLQGAATESAAIELDT